MRKFVVTNTFTVEVTDSEIASAEKRVGRPVDAKKIAVMKSIERLVEVLSDEKAWGGEVNVHFDVQEVTN